MIRIEADAIQNTEHEVVSAPIRLITNQSKLRVTLKRRVRMHTCSFHTLKQKHAVKYSKLDPKCQCLNHSVLVCVFLRVCVALILLRISSELYGQPGYIFLLVV